MAYGFRHIPRERQARQPDGDRCEYCRALLDLGSWPHTCKEVIYGSAVTPTRTIPFGGGDG
jgi:hypothetical protein